MKSCAGKIILIAALAFAVGHVRAASISNVTFTNVADSSPPTNNLTAVGTQDWEIYSDNTPPTTYDHKFGGKSIAMSAPVTALPAIFEVLGSATVRSKTAFTWTDGTTTGVVTANNVDDCGFKYSGTNATVGYGTNYETIIFVPGDTNPHTIHLYGYFANNVNGSLQFTASLAGATTSVTNPPTVLGDFDYSLTFQADHGSDALAVVFTFQKTNTSTSIMAAAVQAAAMSGTPPGVPVVNWRVVPEDTNYPTSEVIVAGVAIGDPNFQNPLPSNPSNQDCTATFQEAIDLMSAAGGGTVFVPPGHYMFTNSLTLDDGVILRGRWELPGSNQPVVGTILDIYATNAAAFITGSGAECGVRDLAFWYPQQNATNQVPYPYTLVNPNGGLQTIENITLVNSYLGLNLYKCSFECVRGVYGTALTTGVFIDAGHAVPRFDDIHFSPDYWAWSKLTNAPTNSIAKAALAAFMLTNGIGVDMREVDGTYVQNITISGYNYGIRFARGASGDNAGGPEFFNVLVTNCTEALRFDSTKGLQAFGCTFIGTTNGYGIHRLADRGGDFFNCTISGGAAALLGDSTNAAIYVMNLQSCLLTGVVNIGGNNAALQLISSSFTGTGTNVILNPGVNQALICGGTNTGSANVLNNSGAGAGQVLITNGLPLTPLPYFPTSYPKTRKPDKVALFNVTSTNFAGGAKGNGVTNDTAAIQAAIFAAQTNGGGIVFFPAGTYLVTSNLMVTNGVELRGIFGGRHGNGNLGSLLEINVGAGSSNGTPFITLGDRCGIRGMNFDYPNQNWQLGTQIPYPYMIRCQGVTNYVVDCCVGDVYQGVDLNGAKTALVDYCFFGGLVNTYIARNGATDCLIQNSHIKPLQWWLNANAPPTGDYPASVIASTENTFIAADCTNLTIYSIFNHAAHTLFTLRGGTGQALMLGGEELQRGYVLESNAPAAAGTYNFIGCGANVSQLGDQKGCYGFWLQTNFTGTVSPVSTGISDATADYDVRVDNAAARFVANDISFGQGRGICNIRAAGQVQINNASLNELFSLDVPAGGSFTASQSIMPPMPYVSQAGILGYTNCIINNSFIAADMNETPYRPVGMTVVTNNLVPILVDVFPTLGQTRDPTVRDLIGWHLASGSNFNFHVTSPGYANGARTNVTIGMYYLEDTDGSITVTYDSTNGPKPGATYLLAAANARWTSQSFSVTDARFSGTNGVDISITASNCDPVFLYVYVQSSYLGLPPQLVTPPVAQFTGTPTNGTRPLAVTFTDNSTGSITNLLWNFGDSQTTNTIGGAVVSHSYTNAGSYTVSLVASGSAGSSTNTKTSYITVNVPASPNIGSISVSGNTNVVLTGTGGPTNGTYYYWVRSSTNLTLPLINWSMVSTNLFNADGSFSNALPLNPGSPQQFYRLQLP